MTRRFFQQIKYQDKDKSIKHITQEILQIVNDQITPRALLSPIFLLLVQL